MSYLCSVDKGVLETMLCLYFGSREIYHILVKLVNSFPVLPLFRDWFIWIGSFLIELVMVWCKSFNLSLT